MMHVGSEGITPPPPKHSVYRCGSCNRCGTIEAMFPGTFNFVRGFERNCAGCGKIDPKMTLIPRAIVVDFTTLVVACGACGNTEVDQFDYAAMMSLDGCTGPCRVCNRCGVWNQIPERDEDAGR